MKKVKKLLVPTMVFSAGGYLNLLVDQVVASKIKDGAISILSYSQFIIMIPFFLVTLPLITAIFPEMSRKKVSAGGAALAEITGKAFAFLFAVLLPIFIGLLFFRIPVIELFYSHGKFDSRWVPEAGKVLLAYGPTIIFLSCNNLIHRFFFTKKKMKLLMALTMVSIIANLGMDLYFASMLSLAGIALATSVNEALYFLVVLWILRKELRDIFSLFVRKCLSRSLMAGMAMTIALVVSTGIFNGSALVSKKELLIALFLHATLSLLVYILILFAFFKKSVVEMFTKKFAGKA
jgi:putative peptidoglycan lipid II flippase